MKNDGTKLCNVCGFHFAPGLTKCACPKKHADAGMSYERPVQKADATAFKKFDDGKLRWHLMPEQALEEVLKVLEFGAKRYGEMNWIDNASQVEWTRYQNALERHLKKFKRGADLDSDSNLYELAHLACNALMLLTLQLQKKGVDNRAKDNK